MTDIRRMQIGQVVDYVIEYNERHKKAEQEEEKRQSGNGRRKATQADIDSYFG